MKQLLERYRKLLKTTSEELIVVINEAEDMDRIIILAVMRRSYRTFIAELEELVPPEKPVESAEERRAWELEKKARERREKEKDDKFFKFLDEWDKAQDK
jgi:hypothetical protein